MKGLLSKILIFSSGVLTTVLATPIHSVPAMRHVIFDNYSDSTKIIEERFNSETKDECIKATLALYMVQKYFDEGKIDSGCNPVNRYGKYLDSNFKCSDEEYNNYYIKPAMAQRFYLCSPNLPSQSEGDELCNPLAVTRNYHLTERDIKENFCNSNTGKICKYQYVKFIKSLFYAYDPKYNNSQIMVNTIFDKDNSKEILSIIVYGIKEETAKLIDKVCPIKEEDEGEGDEKEEIKPTPNESTNGKCGKEDGICPSGKCCSKYGWCGTSSIHCDVANGCQSEFGECNGKSTSTTEPVTSSRPESTQKVSTNDQCGKENGRCPNEKCCSKYGWCGTSSKYCDITEGCQSEFGQCNGKKPIHVTTVAVPATTKPEPTQKVSTNDQCGKKYGQCPNGKCCSKYGWCGTSSKYCDASNGCQSEFGKCNGGDKVTTTIPKTTTTKKSEPTLKESVNGKCGPKDGKCPSSKCCSKYGWCGISEYHCGTGCQTGFGKCN